MDRVLKKNLRDVYEHKNYSALLAYRDELIEKINAENVVGETEFDTVKLALSKEFRKQALIQFFEEVEKEISKDD